MSGTTNDAEAFINFQLAMLSDRNDHHEFEKIATRIARRRISANILIANGPVSAGGDQQRDAESYTTYIPDELPHSAGFAAAASRSPVVVACTVQKSSLKAKVLADVAGICAMSAAPVGHIVVFSAISIPEATVHGLQQTTREKYGVTLDIFSGMKVATLLAEPDLIWVAQRHLDLPASHVPQPDTKRFPDWYTELIQDLRQNDGPAILTPATQGEVAAGLRHATWDKDANTDLPEWINFMSPFLEDPDDELAFHACYEITIAHYRGTGQAAAVEDLVRRALSMASTSISTSILEDAAVLLSYWGTMWVSGAGRADFTEIEAAHAALIDHLRSALEATDRDKFPARTASLTGTLAWLHLLPDWGSVEASRGRPQLVETAEGAGIMSDAEVFGDARVTREDLRAVPTAMEYLTDLAILLPRARGYSLGRTSDLVDLYAPILASEPGYPVIRDAFDEAVAAVEGDATVAQRCHSRAVAFYTRGQLLEALHELHKAKTRTIRGDLAEDGVRILRFISQIYLELDLDHAAKMYALHAATFADLSDNEDAKAGIPAALFEAATATHFTGCWIEAAALTRTALLAHTAHAPGALDLDRHPSLANQLHYELQQLVAVRALWPDLEPLLSDAHGKDGLHDLLASRVTEVPFDHDENTFHEEAWTSHSGPVFADLGAERRVDFSALGVRWVFTYANNRGTVLAADGFIAAFQVLLADIARHDPVLTPCTINTRIDVKKTSRGRAVITNAPERPFTPTVVLSETATNIHTFSGQLAGAVVGLVSVAHVRPDADLKAIISSLMEEGLDHKLLCVRTYQDSADLLDEDHYTRSSAVARPVHTTTSGPVDSPHLPASKSLGPGYDHERFVEATRTTYANAENWKYSLAILLSEDSVRARIAQLRLDGWLDWHIVGALINVALQWRLSHLGIDVEKIDPSSEPDFLRRAELADEPPMPLPIDLATIDHHLYLHAVNVGLRWGLYPLPEHESANSLRALLERRYRFADVDVPHRDLLSALDSDGNLLPLVAST